MRVAIACDHVGFALKATIVEALEQEDHAVLDLGTHGSDPIDYPPLAKAVAAAVGKNFVDLGIFLCESGIGGAIAANRFTGIRAVASVDPIAARKSREELDTNFLCVTAAGLAPEAGVALTKEWLGGVFSGSQHATDVLAKIRQIAGTSAPRGLSSERTSARSAPSAAAPAAAVKIDAAPSPAVEGPRAAEVAVMSDISAVMKVVAGVKEPEIKVLATRVLQFLRNRFPTAAGTPTENGFSFTLDDQHVASVTIGKNFVEVEAGPDRVSTSKIRDLERLDLFLNLPSITKSFDAIKF